MIFKKKSNNNSKNCIYYNQGMCNDTNGPRVYFLESVFDMHKVCTEENCKDFVCSYKVVKEEK